MHFTTTQAIALHALAITSVTATVYATCPAGSKVQSNTVLVDGAYPKVSACCPSGSSGLAGYLSSGSNGPKHTLKCFTTINWEDPNGNEFTEPMPGQICVNGASNCLKGGCCL